MRIANVLTAHPASAVRWPGLAVWVGTWFLMLALDGWLNLGNLALLLVMGGAVAGLWLSPQASMLCSAASVLLFNFFFVSPRLSFVALLHEDLLLLLTLLGVSTGISYLLARMRGLMQSERLHAAERERSLLAERAAVAEAEGQKLRNTLLTAVSHDFRTPLATVTGAASTLSTHAGALPREQVRTLAEAILEEAGHLNRITSNTLQLARLDAQPMAVRLQWESPTEILSHVLARARRNYPGRELQMRLPDAMPLLKCDATLMVQLFDNLIDNAIKYSPDDSCVSVLASLAPDALTVQVRDRGAGIPAPWKDKVFDAFQRVDHDDALADAGDGLTPRRGVGVGLAVCRAIARVHGAQLSIDDEQPHGTVVSLTLPVGLQPSLSGLSPEEALP